MSGFTENQKNSRRLELSISKNTPHGRWGQGPGSVDPRFPAGLPFPVPEILEFVAFGGSGKFFQQFSRNFPGTFLQNSRKDPRNSHGLLEFSELRKRLTSREVAGKPPGKSPGNFRGRLGNFRGTSGLLLSSTARELPGKSPKKKLWGSSGNFRGSPGTFQKLGGAWLPPSDSPNLSPITLAWQRSQNPIPAQNIKRMSKGTERSTSTFST